MQRKISNSLIIMLALLGCHSQGKKIELESQTTSQKTTQNQYTLNTDLIRKHFELQDHLEKSEDDGGSLYSYSIEDILVALPVIAQGLSDNGFRKIDQASFDSCLKRTFGDIFGSDKRL